ncbi:MAG: hypothetical protein ACK4ZJ_19140, partial [Allorhizobium sp.]
MLLTEFIHPLLPYHAALGVTFFLAMSLASVCATLVHARHSGQALSAMAGKPGCVLLYLAWFG